MRYHINEKRNVKLWNISDDGMFEVWLKKKEVLALALEVLNDRYICTNWTIKDLAKQKKYKIKKLLDKYSQSAIMSVEIK
jgi:hypothetical protein